MPVQIIGIGAVHDNGGAQSLRNGNHARPELGLAEVAPIRRVRGVPRILELAGVDFDDRNADGARDVARVLPLALGIGFSASDHRRHEIGAQRLDGHSREIGRIDTTAIADGDGPVRAHPGHETLLLRLGVSGLVIGESFHAET